MFVFLTVDTEVWSFYNDINENIESAVFGKTGDGEYGLRYQLELFEKYGLKANYFVEPLFTLVSETGQLKRIVDLIKTFDQDVQLHIHTEWLKRSNANLLKSGKFSDNIKDFSLDEQSKLIEISKKLIEDCGIGNVNAFRAGNYGGNFDTLKALKSNGIDYDTTYNACYLDGPCDMKTEQFLIQPAFMCGVCEIPITFIRDFPGHHRHLQITACSVAEIKNALLAAWRNDWFSVVIVLHSFEVLKRCIRNKKRFHIVDKIVLNRMTKICEFLSQNEDKFKTAHFSDLRTDEMDMTKSYKVIKSKTHFTLARYLIQMYRRFLLPYFSKPS